MFAYILLLVAALSRIVPHHFSFTAVGGSLLYFGARRSRWQIVFPVMLLAATDIFLTTVMYGYAFHLRDYVVTWLWYAGACLLGRALLRQHASFARVIGAGFASATSFFLLSNFVVWAAWKSYPPTAAGLSACYAAGLPFYARDLVATTLVIGCALGIEALVKQMAASRRAGHSIAA